MAKARKQTSRRLRNLKAPEAGQGKNARVSADAVRGGVAPLRPKGFTATFHDVIVS